MPWAQALGAPDNTVQMATTANMVLMERRSFLVVLRLSELTIHPARRNVTTCDEPGRGSTRREVAGGGRRSRFLSCHPACGRNPARLQRAPRCGMQVAS